MFCNGFGFNNKKVYKKIENSPLWKLYLELTVRMQLKLFMKSVNSVGEILSLFLSEKVEYRIVFRVRECFIWECRDEREI